jgi:hypothetical protein
MINGDNIKGFWDRLLYFPQCIIAAMKGSRKNLDIVSIKLKEIDFSSGSPVRNLSNMFWETLDWKNLTYQLGGAVNIFDIACGSGNYGIRYQNLLGEGFGSYTGIDIYKDKKFPTKYKHILNKAEKSTDYLDGHNLIVSQSGLEHIENDKFVLKKITKFLNDSKKPFIQIHVVPASASLILYLWHGWRQYSAKNLGAISKILTSSKKIKVKAIPLGGWTSFYTHLRQITIPHLLKRMLKIKLSSYNIKKSTKLKKIKSSVLKDKYSKDYIPINWVFIIYSDGIDFNSLFKKF